MTEIMLNKVLVGGVIVNFIAAVLELCLSCFDHTVVLVLLHLKHGNFFKLTIEIILNSLGGSRIVNFLGANVEISLS